MSPEETARVDQLIREYRRGPRDVTIPMKFFGTLLILAPFGLGAAARLAGIMLEVIWRDVAPVWHWLVASF